jgi:probable HAF family extracellular repeat protein
VVGVSIIGGVSHAFLWQDGVMQDLEDLAQLPQGLHLGSAMAINDSGMIVGQTCGPITQCPPGTTVGPRAFLLVPNNPGGGAGGRAGTRVRARTHR